MTDTNSADNEQRPVRAGVPTFAPGLVVSTTTMVVDVNGVAWWVLPGSMLVIPVLSQMGDSIGNPAGFEPEAGRS